MVILALDTSSAAGSAAVARDGVVLVEREGDGTRTHGERLPRELMTILEEAGVALRDVDRFAVATGPGSFTGLRVGIATIQGLALAQHKLVVPVSSFDALASVCQRTSNVESRTSELIAVWIDAHRGEVFGCLYDSDARTMVQPPSSRAPDATLGMWARAIDGHCRVQFAGDGAIKYAESIRARLGQHAVIPSSVPSLAGKIASIAAAEPQRAVVPHAVVPLYVRRPDAELARDRKAAPKATP